MKAKNRSNWRHEQPAGTKLYKKMLKSMYGTWKEHYKNRVHRK